MYSYIKGELVRRTDDIIVVENNDIGYEIICPFSISSKLGAIGDKVMVHLYQSVREDDISLYGFVLTEQKDMFMLLLGVSGIGPKVAHSICSQVEPDRLALAVKSGDVKFLTSVKGLGKKGAERIILELKDKLKSVNISTSVDVVASSAINTSSAPADTSIIADAIEALLVLGYKQADSEQAVASSYNDNISLEELIRVSLRKLAR